MALSSDSHLLVCRRDGERRLASGNLHWSLQLRTSSSYKNIISIVKRVHANIAHDGRIGDLRALYHPLCQRLRSSGRSMGRGREENQCVIPLFLPNLSLLICDSVITSTTITSPAPSPCLRRIPQHHPRFGVGWETHFNSS
jgi:hypothetical protein